MTTPEHYLLGVRSLNAMVTSFAAEERLNTMFQDKFLGNMIEAEDSEVIEWDEVQSHRHLAPVTGGNSPSVPLQNRQIVNRRTNLAHITINIPLKPSKLYHQRMPGTLRPNAQAYVRGEIRSAVKTMKNTVEYMSVNTLNGTLTVNTTNIPGSQVAFTVTWSPNTYTAGASWATANTDLLGTEIPGFKQDFLQTSGLLPAEVIIGGTINGYFPGNTGLSAQLVSQHGREVARSSGQLFGQALEGFELGGLQWKVNEAVYVPEGGAATRFMPATDDFFVLPMAEDLPEVLGMGLGRGFLPSTQGVATAEQAADLCMVAPQLGYYAYAVRTTDPVSVKIVLGWVGLPLLLFPSGVQVGDAVP